MTSEVMTGLTSTSLLVFTNTTVNSYHRLVPGFEAPISLEYSSRNRSASVRIPITGSNPKAKRVETRSPETCVASFTRRLVRLDPWRGTIIGAAVAANVSP